jgi:hypothetical protein
MTVSSQLALAATEARMSDEAYQKIRYVEERRRGIRRSHGQMADMVI